jgi:hypothetical protein
MEIPPGPALEKGAWGDLNDYPTLVLTECSEKIMINENILGRCKKHHSTQNEA